MKYRIITQRETFLSVSGGDSPVCDFENNASIVAIMLN